MQGARGIFIGGEIPGHGVLNVILHLIPRSFNGETLSVEGRGRIAAKTRKGGTGTDLGSITDIELGDLVILDGKANRQVFPAVAFPIAVQGGWLGSRRSGWRRSRFDRSVGDRRRVVLGRRGLFRVTSGEHEGRCK